MLCWQGQPGDDAHEIPFLVIEVKDPIKLTYTQMEKVLTELHTYVCSPTERASFQMDKKIKFSFLFHHEDRTLMHAAESLFSAISQLNSAMIIGRQTYGMLLTGQAALVLRIDWNHRTQPGQHAYYTLHNCATDETLPEWPNPVTFTDLYHSAVWVAGLQKKTGLVPIGGFSCLRRVEYSTLHKIQL